jgi:ketosteroid isomerase-like protein
MTTARSGTVTEIQTTIDELVNAFRSRNANAIVAHYAPGGTWYSLDPPLTYAGGNEQHRHLVQEWLSGFEGPIEIKIRDLHVEASGDTAICHCLNQLSATQAGGESFAFWFRRTLGLRRIDGHWKITHDHQSVPFHMDGSFLAAVELTP